MVESGSSRSSRGEEREKKKKKRRERDVMIDMSQSERGGRKVSLDNQTELTIHY